MRDGLPTGISGATAKNVCMDYNGENWHLKKDHQYYYQVQAQLNVWDIEKGVFILWANKEFVSESIARDRDFFEGAVDSV